MPMPFTSWLSRPFSRGDPTRPSDWREKALTIRRDLGHVSGIGSLAEVLAYVEIANDQHERAARLFGGVDAIWASISWVLTESALLEHDRVRAETRRSTRGGSICVGLRHGLRI